ncbi:hypothetical protein E4U42_006725 [Claviceps africana]|uniref:Uncharacterized protein n=1 Tax=Claviceps africana TaxID=83212 RepID=A0A8K0NFJ9_9HYPO|nr:hypothetical protein E4U42_006725 [Claviceps africana]
MPRFHWAFLIGPKAEAGKHVPGLRCHVKNPAITGWFYDENKLQDVKCTVNLLVRILVAKIEDEKGLLTILRETPVIQDDPSFTCRTWLADALMRISKAEPKVTGTSQLDWDKIEIKSRRYVEQKVAAGRYRDETQVLGPKPTWDLTSQKEIIA